MAEHVRDESSAASAARHIDTRLVPRLTLLENACEAQVHYLRVARGVLMPGTREDAKALVNEMNDAFALVIKALEAAGYKL